MEQLPLDLAPIEPPGFRNFVPGANREVVACLAALAAGRLPDTGVLLWGAPGGGKTHLLRATVAAAAVRDARYLATPAEVPDDATPSAALVAIDAIDTADAAAQGRIFTLYNALTAGGGHLLTAAVAPPARLPLRDDLRTRLGHGLVFEVQALADEDKAAALEAYAAGRGFRLGAEVIAWLLTHGRRDMPALVATLAALDRYSLATKRAITIPLLRDWLQHKIRLH